MRQNLIKKIEGLENCVQLTDLDLRDNEIEVIEGLETLLNLVFAASPLGVAARSLLMPLASDSSIH